MEAGGGDTAEINKFVAGALVCWDFERSEWLWTYDLGQVRAVVYAVIVIVVVVVRDCCCFDKRTAGGGCGASLIPMIQQCTFARTVEQL